MEAAGSGRQIVGYSYHDIIAYYLLTIDQPGVFQHAGAGGGIARDIRDGTVKKVSHPADRHAGVLTALPCGPQAGLLHPWRRRRSRWCSTCARGYFAGWPDAPTLMACLASLVMSFLLGFFLEATLGMLGFWLLEVNSLLFVYMLLSFFFSGHMFPIDMLPGIWARSSSRYRCNIWPIFPPPCFWAR